jgi:hypothetical protein
MQAKRQITKQCERLTANWIISSKPAIVKPFLQTLLLSSLLFFQSECLLAQYIPMVEESKHWIYYDWQLRARPTTGFVITIQGDTVLGTTAYKKVYKYELSGELKSMPINEPPQFFADTPYMLISKELVSLIREDTMARIVYNLPVRLDTCIPPQTTLNPCNDIIFCDTLEHILFDFSLQSGDTLNYCSYAPIQTYGSIYPKTVDSIRMEVHHGKLRRTFYTYGIASYYPNLIEPGPIPPSKVRIIEGFGFLSQGIFNYRFGRIVEFCEGDFSQCDIISATRDISSNDHLVNVYPNPACDLVIIESEKAIKQVTLFYANAIEVLPVDHENQIDISHLPDGFFICRIELDHGMVITRKLIKISRS